MARGFNSLEGRKITQVDSHRVNEIVILTKDNLKFVIFAQLENGIPVMRCQKFYLQEDEPLNSID